MSALQIVGLVQERRNSSANALELRLSCTTNSSKCKADIFYQIFFNCKLLVPTFTNKYERDRQKPHQEHPMHVVYNE